MYSWIVPLMSQLLWTTGQSVASLELKTCWVLWSITVMCHSSWQYCCWIANWELTSDVPSQPRCCYKVEVWNHRKWEKRFYDGTLSTFKDQRAEEHNDPDFFFSFFCLVCLVHSSLLLPNHRASQGHRAQRGGCDCLMEGWRVWQQDG